MKAIELEKKFGKRKHKTTSELRQLIKVRPVRIQTFVFSLELERPAAAVFEQPHRWWTSGGQLPTRD
jgi:hypothetical protein